MNADEFKRALLGIQDRALAREGKNIGPRFFTMSKDMLARLTVERIEQRTGCSVTVLDDPKDASMAIVLISDKREEPK